MEINNRDRWRDFTIDSIFNMTSNQQESQSSANATSVAGAQNLDQSAYTLTYLSSSATGMDPSRKFSRDFILNCYEAARQRENVGTHLIPLTTAELPNRSIHEAMRCLHEKYLLEQALLTAGLQRSLALAFPLGSTSQSFEDYKQTLQVCQDKEEPLSNTEACTPQHNRLHSYTSHTDRVTGGKVKRIRTAYTPSQLMRLETEFNQNNYLIGQERRRLASQLNLSEVQVKVWYQNRRTKQKRIFTEEHGILCANQTNQSECIPKDLQPYPVGKEFPEISHSNRV